MNSGEHKEIAHRRLNGSGTIERREFLIAGGSLALAAMPLANFPGKANQRGTMQTNNTDTFWPGGARLVISISMQMEAGAQPDSGAESPLPKMDPSIRTSLRPNGTSTGSRKACRGCWTCSTAAM